jgi:hypothetical protein
MGTPNRKKVPELHHENVFSEALKTGSKRPNFGEKHHVQHLSQVTDATRATRTAFEADDAFHSGQMPEPP